MAGEETYDDLARRLLQQYDPRASRDPRLVDVEQTPGPFPTGEPFKPQTRHMLERYHRPGDPMLGTPELEKLAEELGSAESWGDRAITAAGILAGVAQGKSGSYRTKGKPGREGAKEHYVKPEPLPRDLDNGWYLKGIEALRNTDMGNKRPINEAAWRKFFEKEGVKQVEQDAHKLDEFFKANPTATREQLLKYYQDNRVRVQETVYGKPNPAHVVDPTTWGMTGEVKRFQDHGEAVQYAKSIGLTDKHVEQVQNAPIKWKTHGGQNLLLDPQNPTNREIVMATAPSQRERDIESRMKTNQTEIHALSQRPGFRDIEQEYAVAKLAGDTPDSPGWKPGQANSAAKAARMLEAYPDLAKYRALRDENNSLLDELKKITANPYKEAHFPDVPNYLAHLRTGIYKDAQGRTVIAGDEAQTTRGQQVRDSEAGPRDEAKIAETARRKDETMKQGQEIMDRAMVAHGYDKLNPDARHDKRAELHAQMLRTPSKFGSFGPEYANNHNSYVLLGAELEAMRQAPAGHPLINDMSTASNLMMRKLLMEGVKSGVDGVTLTPGPMQNERYSLAKQVGALRYNPKTHELNFTDPVTAQQWEKPSGTFSPMGWSQVPEKVPPDKLASHLGKEVAEKLLAQPVATEANSKLLYHAPGWHELRDLKSVELGGQGMREYYGDPVKGMLGRYDNTLNKELSALDPQWPGRQQTRLESADTHPEAAKWDTSLDTVNGRAVYKPPFQYYPITPRVKEEVAKGLPLFTVAGLMATPAINAMLGQYEQPTEAPDMLSQYGDTP